MAALPITVNGDSHEVPDQTTVAAFLAARKIEPRLVVIEHNGEILTREKYAGTVLNAGDQIEIVRIVGGG